MRASCWLDKRRRVIQPVVRLFASLTPKGASKMLRATGYVHTVRVRAARRVLVKPDCISLALRAPYGTLQTCERGVPTSRPNFEPRAARRTYASYWFVKAYTLYLPDVVWPAATKRQPLALSARRSSEAAAPQGAKISMIIEWAATPGNTIQMSNDVNPQA